MGDTSGATPTPAARAAWPWRRHLAIGEFVLALPLGFGLGSLALAAIAAKGAAWVLVRLP